MYSYNLVKEKTWTHKSKQIVYLSEEQWQITRGIELKSKFMLLWCDKARQD